MDLCLTSTYFQYKSKHYKQLHGPAMGSPVSIVVKCKTWRNRPLQLTVKHYLVWLDDTITTVRKNKIYELFLKHLNKQSNGIQFIMENKGNGKIPFLYCLVTCKNNTLGMNHCLQETNTHWHTTWPNVLQSYFTRSDYGTNLDEKSTKCLWLRRQFDGRNPAREHCFYQDQLQHRRHRTQSDWTAALNTHTPLQPLYLTNEGPQKL